MSVIFGNDVNIRGCFTVILLDAQASRGASLIMPDKSTLPLTMDYKDPLLIVGFSSVQHESTSFIKTFGGRVYSYAFGFDPNASRMAVDLIGFMVDGKRYSEVVGKVNKSYAANRISQNPKYAMLSLGNSRPLRGFVVGIESSTADPEISLQRFTLHMALVEVQ